VAGPGLEGGQVAVLCLHAALAMPRDQRSILLCEEKRMPQMSDLCYCLVLLARSELRRTHESGSSTSENSVKAKFAQRVAPGKREIGVAVDVSSPRS
jgi:hypothetical protein